MMYAPSGSFLPVLRPCANRGAQDFCQRWRDGVDNCTVHSVGEVHFVGEVLAAFARLSVGCWLWWCWRRGALLLRKRWCETCVL